MYVFYSDAEQVIAWGINSKAFTTKIFPR